MNKVSVISLDKRFQKSKGEIKKIVLKILKILNKSNILVEIYLIDNRRMKYLNKKFRGQDKTTTVLSFEEPRNFIYPPERGTKIKRIGEIYIKFPITNYSITQLLCHSLLHLLGYNHQKKNDRIKMERKEQKLLLKIRSTKHEIRNNI